MKAKTFFSLYLALLSLQLSADNATTMRNLEYRLQNLEFRKDPCSITPSARPTQKCDWGSYITIDPLFLKAQENGLEFVVITQNQQQFDPTNFVLSNHIFGNTKYKTVNFELDWGFRLGIGINLPHDGWDISMHWTRFLTEAHKHVKSDANTFLTPLFVNNQLATNVADTTLPPVTLESTGQGLFRDASCHWNMHLNEIDLELGRFFFASKWLIIKPHAGLRTAWVRQKDNIAYENFLSLPDFFPIINDSFQTMKCHFWGLGILGGVDTQWGLTCGWSLFANFAASLLYGYFDISTVESNDGLSSPDGITTIPFSEELYNAHEFRHSGKLITDFAAGLRYDYLFCEERYHLGFQAGWEMHILFGQNQFFKFVSGDPFPGESITNNGDLTLQGLSAQVRFDF